MDWEYDNVCVFCDMPTDEDHSVPYFFVRTANGIFEVCDIGQAVCDQCIDKYLVQDAETTEYFLKEGVAIPKGASVK